MTISRQRFLYLSLALLPLLLYWQTLEFPFIDWDDTTYITDNPYVNKGLSWNSLKWAFIASDPYWMPITWLSYQLEVTLFGVSAAISHAGNALLHTLNTLLLFSFIYRISRLWHLSFLTAYLFAFHPQHVEAVAWIAERKEVLSAFFALLTLHGYLSFIHHRDHHPQPLRKHKKAWLPLSIALLCYALSLSAKAIWVTLPVLLLLLDYWPLQRYRLPYHQYPWFDLLKEKLPFLIVAFFIMEWILLLAKDHNLLNSFTQISIEQRLWAFYLSPIKQLFYTFWPFDLSPHFTLPRTPPSTLLFTIALSCWLFFSYFILRFYNKTPHLVFALLWLFIASLPTSGLVQSGVAVAMTNRWSYLPHIGLFIGLLSFAYQIFQKYPQSRKPFLLLILFILPMLLYQSHQQIKIWRNDLTLWQYALKIDPENATAHRRLAAWYIKEQQHQKATEHLKHAARYGVHQDQMHALLGFHLLRTGDQKMARRHFNTAIYSGPPHSLSLEQILQLANRLFQLNWYPQAVGYYQRIIDHPQSHPLKSFARFRLALSQSALGHHKKSQETLTPLLETLKTEPKQQKAWCQKIETQTAPTNAFKKIDQILKQWCKKEQPQKSIRLKP
ncbi:tetratricopeptide repeat protein [Magnetococcales bacterium HHB-1]